MTRHRIEGFTKWLILFLLAFTVMIIAFSLGWTLRDSLESKAKIISVNYIPKKPLSSPEFIIEDQKTSEETADFENNLPETNKEESVYPER